MNVKLTTGEKLKDLRAERHLTLEDLSREIHIAVSTLSNYENDENYDISAANITAIADYYGVATDFLLGRTENRKGNRTEIEDLHLDDDVLEILKDRRINNRLLCEMIKDPDFIKLMAEIEIYVDGIAQMQINNMNSYVDAIRDEIIRKYHPDENDQYLAVLNAVRIDEGHYFTDRMQKNLDEIISRIRNAHKNDKATMSEPTAKQEILNSLKAANDFKGSFDEKMVFLCCDQLEINYKSLSSEEVRTLVKILKKSKKLKRGASNRGRNYNK